MTVPLAAHTVRLVAGTVATSVFAGEPQPVEIHHRGLWYSGELLGWRHEDDGRVVARVRCVVDGLRHSTWKDLGELRLPDPRRPPRREAFPATPAATSAGSTSAADEDDATRPHVLLADLRSRRPKPAHAVTPPAPARSVEPWTAPPAVRPPASDRRKTRVERQPSLSTV